MTPKNKEKMKDFTIPERRYAMFTDLIGGDYLTVLKGNDILTGPKWGGFVKWVGGIRKEEKRTPSRVGK